MRTSKFRVWDVRTNRMRSWNEMRNCYCDELDFMSILSGDYRDEIPLEYTGLKDKNGVEICEGDILKGKSGDFGDVIGAVCLCEYDDNEGYVHYVHLGWNVCGIPLFDLLRDGCLSIGNIYENPELVK